MKNLILLSIATLFVMSCAHGKTEHFPTVADHSQAAEVFVIRDDSLMGWGVSLKVALGDVEAGDPDAG